MERIQRGETQFFEPGLADLVRKGQAQGRFEATISAGKALEGSEVSVIAVGTPDRNGAIDLRYVLEVAGTLGISSPKLLGSTR